jgi:hypothetical protein
MARQIGITILAVAAMHSATNAFVPLDNHAKIASPVSTFERRRSLVSRRGYSNNNVNDNNKKDRFITPEPIDPTPSSSPDQIEFLFEESVILNEIGSPRVSPQSEEISDVDAQTILAENAAILSSGGDSTIDLGFDLNVDSNTNPAIDSTADVIVNEDLKAVLAASIEAAATAEASMSPELVEVLDELAVVALNATTLNTNNLDEVLVSPPEVVPTIATISPPIIPAEQQEQQMPPILMVPTLSPDDLDIDVSESSNDINDRIAAVITPPSVKKILKFAVPAIGVWLCGPILSLIDTSAVGVLSGTVQQAALNPAVAVTDYAALLIVS